MFFLTTGGYPEVGLFRRNASLGEPQPNKGKGIAHTEGLQYYGYASCRPTNDIPPKWRPTEVV